MRTTLKIVLPLIVSVGAVWLLFAAYQVRTEKRNLRNDLVRRAEILAESLQETIEPLLDHSKPNKNLQRIVTRFGQREHLKGIAVYDQDGNALAMTSGLPRDFQKRPAVATKAAQIDKGYGEFVTSDSSAALEGLSSSLHIYALPLHKDDAIEGTLAVVHDTSYIASQVAHTMRDALL